MTAVVTRADRSRGSEAQYFSCYEISDAGTSFLGPLLFGLAYQNTGNYRSALASLVVTFVVGQRTVIPCRRVVRRKTR